MHAAVHGMSAGGHKMTKQAPSGRPTEAAAQQFYTRLALNYSYTKFGKQIHMQHNCRKRCVSLLVCVSIVLSRSVSLRPTIFVLLTMSHATDLRSIIFCTPCNGNKLAIHTITCILSILYLATSMHGPAAALESSMQQASPRHAVVAQS